MQHLIQLSIDLQIKTHISALSWCSNPLSLTILVSALNQEAEIKLLFLLHKINMAHFL